MRTRYLSSLMVLALVAPAASATGPDPILRPQSRIWVDGTSTVRAFSCKASTYEADIQASSEAVSAVLAGEKAIKTVEFTIPSKKLDCGNGTMNEHMFKAIKADQNATIGFKLASYELVKGAQGVTAKLTGKLSLGGVEKTITLDAAAKEGANGTLQVIGSKDIKLSDFGLKAPTLMMGTMKVNDQVKVGFDLLIKL